MYEYKPLIVSFPKSGRTWVRAFFMLYQKETGIHVNCKFKHVLYKAAPSFKRVFLVREPCDTLVSWYYQAKYRSRYNYETKNIAAFIRDTGQGAKRLNWYWNKWLKRDGECLEIRYEDLFDNIWTEILEFLNVKVIPDAVDKVHKMCEFSNLKKNLNVYFDDANKKRFFPHLHNKIVENPENNNLHKFRVGKVGGYVNYLDQEDINYVRKSVPEAARWYKEYA